MSFSIILHIATVETINNCRVMKAGYYSDTMQGRLARNLTRKPLPLKSINQSYQTILEQCNRLAQLSKCPQKQANSLPMHKKHYICLASVQRRPKNMEKNLPTQHALTSALSETT